MPVRVFSQNTSLCHETLFNLLKEFYVSFIKVEVQALVEHLVWYSLEFAIKTVLQDSSSSHGFQIYTS